MHVGQLLIVSVSGGADSVALLHLLVSLRTKWSLRLHVLHFNHALRKEAPEEEKFVRALAQQFKLPFHVRRQPSGWDRIGPGGVQERSRSWRRAESLSLLAELQQSLAVGEPVSHQPAVARR